jgi:hypothetical protein
MPAMFQIPNPPFPIYPTAPSAPPDNSAVDVVLTPPAVPPDVYTPPEPISSPTPPTTPPPVVTPPAVESRPYIFVECAFQSEADALAALAALPSVGSTFVYDGTRDYTAPDGSEWSVNNPRSIAGNSYTVDEKNTVPPTGLNPTTTVAPIGAPPITQIGAPPITQLDAYALGSELIRYAVTDNSDGTFPDGRGFVDYDTATATIQLTRPFYTKWYNADTESWSTSVFTETEASGSVTVTYSVAADGVQPEVETTVDVSPITVDLAPNYSGSLVPGTWRFIFGNRTYSDRDGGGVLYVDDIVMGYLDYITHIATLTDWSGSAGELQRVFIISGLGTRGDFTTNRIAFRTASAPIAQSSLQVVGTSEYRGEVIFSGDSSGLVVDSGANITPEFPVPVILSGSVNYASGFCVIDTLDPIYPHNIVYSAVAYSIIPLRPEIIGINPVLLPADGRVPKVRAGDYAIIFEDAEMPAIAAASSTQSFGTDVTFAVIEDGAGEQTETITDGIIAGATLELQTRNARTGTLDYLVLRDSAGRDLSGDLYTADLITWSVTFSDPINLADYDLPIIAYYKALMSTDDYTVDLAAGEIRYSDTVNLGGYTQPLLVRYRTHDLSIVTEVQPNGILTLQKPLSHSYTTSANVSSLLLHGDLKARVVNFFEQNTVGDWADDLVGDPPANGARYDITNYPVVVSNAGAIRERWRVKRRSDGQWDIIGETMGVIMIWDGVSTLQARRYPSQPYPYFTLYHEGLGLNWMVGNFMQFETFASQSPIWLLRTTLPSSPSTTQDCIRLRHRIGAA